MFGIGTSSSDTKNGMWLTREGNLVIGGPKISLNGNGSTRSFTADELAATASNATAAKTAADEAKTAVSDLDKTVKNTYIPLSSRSIFDSKGTVVTRGNMGETHIRTVVMSNIQQEYSNNIISMDSVVQQIGDGKGYVQLTKQPNDYGQMSNATLQKLQTRPQLMINYDSKVYYRATPLSTSTMTYVHAGCDSSYQLNCEALIVQSNGHWRLEPIEIPTGETTPTTIKIYMHNISISNSSGTVRFCITNTSSTKLTSTQIKSFLNWSYPAEGEKISGNAGFVCGTLVNVGDDELLDSYALKVGADYSYVTVNVISDNLIDDVRSI